MGDKTSLGDRMKGYENISRLFLTRRTPVIIRLDGKAFHTFTKGLDRPFDLIMQKTMQDTMKYLCENIQNCKLGYTQSDEITLLLIDYEQLETDAWFGNNIQKMVSVSASMATLAFNKFFRENTVESIEKWREYMPYSDLKAKHEKYINKFDKAMFDSRVFTLPKEEVCNCFIWRQQDASRNSVQSVGQANFSHKELHKKSINMIQEMLFSEKGINWNNLPTTQKRGSCCIKNNDSWIIDNEIPIFTLDRNYVEKYVFA